MPQDEFEWPDNVQLRRWQREAYGAYLEKNKRDFLLVATPGSGKTICAGRIIHYWMAPQEIQFTVVVTPTDHLRQQWARALSRLNLDFLPDWTNSDGDPPMDIHGVVVTYQQLSWGTDLLRRLVYQRPSAVIIDEIHHAGEYRKWGEALLHAFEFARYRLALSGTPFRSDNAPIPFVEYDIEGCSKADFRYEYADALREGIVRYVFFPSYEGQMEWVSRSGTEIRATFGDLLDDQLAAERLRTALDARGEWLNTVIADAHQKLMHIRQNGHEDAGGLVIAIDQTHARQIAKRMKEIIGIEPIVAISDEPEPSALISQFADSDYPWLVAVRMVSEGVDIPRLRIGIYATTVTTELFFRQAVGRFVRWIDALEDQPAYLYIPAHETIVEHAKALQEERDHVLYETVENMKREGANGPEIYESLYVAIAAEAEEHDTIFGDKGYTPEELHFAQSVLSSIGAVLTEPTLVAAVIRHVRSQEQQNNIPKPKKDASPHFTRRKNLRIVCSTLANRVAAQFALEPKDVHMQWLGKGGSNQASATLEDLERKKAWLIKVLQEGWDVF